MLEIDYSRLRKIREHKLMTIRELEYKSGVSRSHICDIENNHTHPTLYTMLLLADAMEVEVNELYVRHSGQRVHNSNNIHK